METSARRKELDKKTRDEATARVRNFYLRVGGTAVREKRDELVSNVGAELVQRTLDGLMFWVDVAERRNVGWALIVAKKPM